MIQLKLLSTTLSQPNQILTQILDITSIRKFDSIPQNKIVTAIINKYSSSGKYPYDLGLINGVSIKGLLECKTVPRLNPNYTEIQGFGFKWLQKLKLVPSDDILETLPKNQYDKINQLKNTHSELLSALTLPDVNVESLKLATMLNMWLFVVDNFFDRYDSEVAENSDIVTSIFNKFIDSFNGVESVFSVDLSISACDQISVFSNGIREIGEMLRVLVQDQELISNVLFGLELYKRGNILETMKKGSFQEIDMISVDEFMQVRNNAGAVDLVFELAYALKNIQIREIREPIKVITSFNKGKICYINDIFSCIKESNEKLDNENYVLITKGNFQDLSIFQAIKFVEKQINKISPGVARETQLVTRFLVEDLNFDVAIKTQEEWDVGHLVWELATINGRYPKNPVIDVNDII